MIFLLLMSVALNRDTPSVCNCSRCESRDTVGGHIDEISAGRETIKFSSFTIHFLKNGSQNQNNFSGRSLKAEVPPVSKIVF